MLAGEPLLALYPATTKTDRCAAMRTREAQWAHVVLDFTERFRRISEGIAILQLSSGDEISLEIPAQAKIINPLALSVERFRAFDLLSEFGRRGLEENHPDLENFQMAVWKVAGFDPDTRGGMARISAGEALDRAGRRPGPSRQATGRTRYFLLEVVARFSAAPSKPILPNAAIFYKILSLLPHFAVRSRFSTSCPRRA